MKATLSRAGEAPIFIIPDVSPHLARVYASVYLKKHKAWMFPAYPPFLEMVLNDLRALDVEFDEHATDYLEKLPTQAQLLKQVKEAPVLGPFTSYAHQFEGTAELLRNPRWALRWEMGTGKTKVAVDALIHLQRKALVIAPSIALDNWVREVRVQSGGTLSVVAIEGATKAKKLKIVERAIAGEFDVVVASYDMARLYGVPTHSKHVEELLGSTVIPMSTQVKNMLKQVDDETADKIYAAWKGMAKMSVLQAMTDAAIRPNLLQTIPFEVIILDESHRIKNIKSKRTKIITALGKKAHHRYLLTGTMSMGNPLDLYPQLAFLARYICPESYFDFKKLFCTVAPYNENIVTGYKNLHILNERLNTISSARSINDCVDLPELQDIDIKFSLTKEQIRDYNSIQRNIGLDFGAYGTVKNFNGGVRLNKMLQICSGFIYAKDDHAAQVCDDCLHLFECVERVINPGTKKCKRYAELKGLIVTNTLRYPVNPKLETLKGLLEDLLEDPAEKVVIWANLDAEMDDIEALLIKQKLQYVRVDGSTSSKISALVNTFDNDPNCRVYLGQESTGIAINLVVARYAVYYSRSWYLEHWLQSRAREYRIGQTRKTVIYRLVADNSLEISQLIALDTRQDIAKMLSEQVNCLLCDSYVTCAPKGITAWSSKCKYKKVVDRTAIKPERIQSW
jgi:SNF2 family DNA or RNA helicase